MFAFAMFMSLCIDVMVMSTVTSVLYRICWRCNLFIQLLACGGEA